MYPSPSPAPSFALLTRPACPSRNFAGTPFSPPPPPCFAHPGAAFPQSDNSARSRNPERNRNPDPSRNPYPSRNPDRTPDWCRTSAARSRSRSPQPVLRSSRLRLRRQHLHTATTRQPVTSSPITARKAGASPTATTQTRTATQTERRTGAGPQLHAAAPGLHNPSAGPSASAFVGKACTQQPSASP